MSNEINSIYQAGFLGFLVGACYGGFISSRVAYMNFMERNQATAFKSSFEAKVSNLLSKKVIFVLLKLLSIFFSNILFTMGFLC